jgi:hypothetical protein
MHIRMETFRGLSHLVKRMAVSHVVHRTRHLSLAIALTAIAPGLFLALALAVVPVTTVRGQIVSNNWSNTNSGSDFVANLTAHTALARDPIASYPASNKQGVVIVGPQLAKHLKELGPNVVFYTSRTNPLRRLAEINDADNQFAAWGVPTDFQITDVIGIKYQIGGELRNPRFIGNLNFSRLFLNHPNLKLFVTSRTISGVDSIESSGGGLKVKLVEMPPR